MAAKYIVKDSYGVYLRTFSSWKAAQSYKDTMGRQDWQIIPCKNLSTLKQCKTVQWIRRVTAKVFIGDINDFEDCRKYINKYINLARAYD